MLLQKDHGVCRGSNNSMKKLLIMLQILVFFTTPSLADLFSESGSATNLPGKNSSTVQPYSHRSTQPLMFRLSP